MFESDVVVIGAGVMGSATSYALAHSGLSVNLVEQFDPGHNRGSSHGSSRIFRFSYPDPMYVEMAQESLSLWRAAEERTGQSLVVTTGGLDVGEGIEANADSLQSCGAPFEMVKGPDVAARWPQVHVADDEIALWQPDAGVALADHAVSTFLRAARRAGVRLHRSTRVERLEITEEGVDVFSGDKVFHAGVAVVTAGGWAKSILSTVGVTLDVRPTRETVSYFSIPGPPPTLVDWSDPAVYALPAPGYGLKAGEHIAGPTTDPDETGELSEDSIERVSAWVSRRFPTADPTPAHAETCIYTNTPDEHFVIERHGQIVVGSACSGHGFKFAPLIGKRLAELATR
ncbi:MAG: N-methyl-L-tryptophan oxidase [Actinomycetota bacterium]